MGETRVRSERKRRVKEGNEREIKMPQGDGVGVKRAGVKGVGKGRGWERKREGETQREKAG